MVVHELKCHLEFFDAIADGRKTFEVRKNDRGFQAGDRLVLRKWNPNGMYGPGYVTTSGYAAAGNAASAAATVTVDVTYVLAGHGVERDFVVMAIWVVSP